MENVDLKLDLQSKLSSGLYNFSKIQSDTDVSRYWLNGIKLDGINTTAPKHILVALDVYFKSIGN